MSRQVKWTKTIVDEFVNEAMLSEDEEKVIRTRAKGWTRTKQALEFGMSISSIDRIIVRLKKKYDAVAVYDSLLPARKKGAEDLFAD